MDQITPKEVKILENPEDIQERREQVLGRYANFKAEARNKRDKLEDSRRFQVCHPNSPLFSRLPICRLHLSRTSIFSTLSEMRMNSRDGSTRSSKRPPMRVTRIRLIYRRRSRSTRPLRQKSPLIQTPSCCSIIPAQR